MESPPFLGSEDSTITDDSTESILVRNAGESDELFVFDPDTEGNPEAWIICLEDSFVDLSQSL